MVGGDGTDDLRPANSARAASINAAADRLQHHLARMQHIALVAVIKGQGAKCPLHHHLAQAHGARLQGDIGNPMNCHAW